MQSLKPEALYQYMKALGFGKATGLLPRGSGETHGYFPSLEHWVKATSYYMPIGQGFSLTPIQLLRAGASLVNGGKLLRPYVAWRIRSPENNSILHEQQPMWEKVPLAGKSMRRCAFLCAELYREEQGVVRAFLVSK